MPLRKSDHYRSGGITIDIDWIQLPLIWAAVLFASLLRSFTGFGFALAAVPVFSMFLPPAEAVVLSSSLALAISLLSLPSYWGIVSLREMVPLVSTSLLGTMVGAALLTGISVALFQLWVGLSVLLACLGITLSRPAKPLKNPALPWATGGLSGLMNGALGIPGPPMIIFAMLTEFDPRRSRALLMTFFVVSSSMALISYSVAGLVKLPSLWYFLLAFPVLYLGDKLGTRLFLRYGDAFYRRVALLGLAAIGVMITLRALLAPVLHQ
ncbi:MAG: sulfite exporter TauE/SafE family protein [Halioglobus sp.]